ncbi:MAG: TetR-like C-terminal domain-containing protein [Actinomycetota bacterium]
MSKNGSARLGRPLSAEVERAVFAETMRLVDEGDASEITRRSIAAGAGVSRQTLYNRWATTADIVLDALIDRAAASVGVAASDDLRSYLVELAAAVEGWARPGLRAVVGLAQLDDDFAERFRARFLDTRHAALTRAVAESGALDDLAAAQVAELIAGSLWFRVLVSDRPLDDEWVERMAQLAR